VNARAGSDNRTALHVAAYEGHAEVVQLLLHAGAAVDASSADDSLTPLHIAASERWHSYCCMQAQMCMPQQAVVAAQRYIMQPMSAGCAHVHVCCLALFSTARPGCCCSFLPAATEIIIAADERVALGGVTHGLKAWTAGGFYLNHLSLTLQSGKTSEAVLCML
jgi:hypothetical protein